MLSNDTAFRLDHAVTDDKVGDEIAARLISTTPANQAQAQAVLAILDPSDKMQKNIAERLYTGLAGDHDGAAGKEVAKKINGMVAVLQAKANGASTPATAGTFTGQVAGMTTDVTITAVTPGAAGNITLGSNGVTELNVLIAGWNIAYPSNQITLTSGDGAQVPNEDIELTGGSEASDSDLVAAKAAMGSELMSVKTKECVLHALADQKAADEFEAAYNSMVVAVQAIS